jgi:hypothetical protein
MSNFHHFLLFFSSCIDLRVHDSKQYFIDFQVLILQNQTTIVKLKAKELDKKRNAKKKKSTQ